MKAIIGFILYVIVLAGTIVIGEGMSGFRPFLLAETMAQVVLGTAVVVLFTFPLKTIRETIKVIFSGNPEADKEAKVRACDLFHMAARYGLTLGIIATMFGVILTFFSVTEVNVVPIKLGFALTGLFYGFLVYLFFDLLENRIKNYRA